MHLKTLVSTRTHTLAHEISRLVGDQAVRCFQFFSPSLSLVIDPKNPALTRNERDLVYGGSIDLLITSSPPDAWPLCVIDISDDRCYRNQRKTGAKSHLLRRLGIPYFLDVPLAPLSAAAIAQQVLFGLTRGASLNPYIRKLVNKKQLEAVTTIETALAGLTGVKILHEIALSEVFNLDHRDFIKRDLRYLKTTNFDALICTPLPNASPLMVVEYDGWHHANNPKKFQNDEEKNECCKQAHLSILRVKSADFASSYEERRAFFSDFLRFAALQVVCDALNYRRAEDESHDYFMRRYSETPPKNRTEELGHFLEEEAGGLFISSIGLAWDILSYEHQNAYDEYISCLPKDLKYAFRFKRDRKGVTALLHFECSELARRHNLCNVQFYEGPVKLGGWMAYGPTLDEYTELFLVQQLYRRIYSQYQHAMAERRI